jgi:hypothetical protein
LPRKVSRQNLEGLPNLEGFIGDKTFLEEYQKKIIVPDKNQVFGKKKPSFVKNLVFELTYGIYGTYFFSVKMNGCF